MTGTRWLASLVGKLREAGLEISPARLVDAARALLAADDLATDRDTLQVVLRVVLAQTRAARPVFDQVFDRFVAAHGPPRPVPRTGRRGPAGAIDAHSGGGRAVSHGATAPTRKPSAPSAGRAPSPLPRVEPSPEPPPQRREGAPAVPQEQGRAAEAERGRDEVERRMDGDPPLEASSETLLAWAEQVWREQEARAEWAAAVGPARPAAPPSRVPTSGTPPHFGQRRGRPARVAPDEPVRPPLTADVLEAVRRMASALWLRRSRRSRRFKRGRVDMKATLAHSFRSGGTPFRLVRRRRRLQRARLLLLLDVSGSMRDSAPFVLALARGMREAFRTVGVFAFVDHPVRMESDDLSALDVNWMSQSDYGNTFFKLLTEHDRVLRKDVLLVVMGDARNNFGDPMAWAVAEIRARVGCMLMLNPEARSRWNTGDSVLSRYAPWCDRVLRCATVADLKCVAEVLVGRAGRWR